MTFSSGKTFPPGLDPFASNALLSWSYDPAPLVSSQVFTPAAAVIYLAKIPVPNSFTVTNMVVEVTTAGTNYTNAQLGLYSSAGTYLGATAVQASAGANGFGAVGTASIALGSSVIVTGGSGVFVWAGLHMGTNAATAAIFRASLAVSNTINVNRTAATARYGTYTGHATNNLATIGNLTPASITLAASPIWMAIS